MRYSQLLWVTCLNVFTTLIVRNFFFVSKVSLFKKTLLLVLSLQKFIRNFCQFFLHVLFLHTEKLKKLYPETSPVLFHGAALNLFIPQLVFMLEIASIQRQHTQEFVLSIAGLHGGSHGPTPEASGCHYCPQAYYLITHLGVIWKCARDATHYHCLCNSLSLSTTMKILNSI